MSKHPSGLFFGTVMGALLALLASTVWVLKSVRGVDGFGELGMAVVYILGGMTSGLTYDLLAPRFRAGVPYRILLGVLVALPAALICSAPIPFEHGLIERMFVVTFTAVVLGGPLGALMFPRS